MGDGEKAQIGMLIESNNEIKSAIVDLARGMTSLVAFQAKAEQQHLNLTEFKKETKVEIKSHDERLKVVESSSLFNSRVVTGILIIGSTTVGSLVTWFISNGGL